MSQFLNDSIFWIEVERIKPNPFQPRKEFDPVQLQSLSDSIRQYGVLQALVVTRKEFTKEDGGIGTEYELIAGERRLRASKLAGLKQVPCLIKTGDETDLVKLELAIIENLQREDLNPIDRAIAFQKLAVEFKMKHVDIGKKVGKSREFISNSIRLLGLPDDVKTAVQTGKISEGHARSLLMLSDKPEEQSTLYKEIIYKKLTVRESELIARKIAIDRARKKTYAPDPELTSLEEKFSESLGTRVEIERRETGGKLVIDFFSNDDLVQLLEVVKSNKAGAKRMLENFIKNQEVNAGVQNTNNNSSTTVSGVVSNDANNPVMDPIITEPLDDRSKQEKEDGDNEELYSVQNFVI